LFAALIAPRNILLSSRRRVSLTPLLSPLRPLDRRVAIECKIAAEMHHAAP
jgi:hypothetical protein